MANEVVTVYDPAGAQNVGTVIAGDLQVSQARRSMVTLPVDPLLVNTALSGYVQRVWGSGWFNEDGRLDRACPMGLGVEPGDWWVYWAAIIARTQTDQVATAGRFRQIAVPGDGFVSAGLSQDAAPPAFEESTGFRFCVQGRNRVQVSVGGVMQLALHGSLSGGRILMTAVTRCRYKFDLPPIVRLGPQARVR